MEGYISDLERELKNIKTKPIKSQDIDLKIILSETDFVNDGGFNARISDDMVKWEIIGLTIKTFRIALCGTYDSCLIDKINIKNAYNSDNYMTYLSYLNFFTKYPNISKEY